MERELEILKKEEESIIGIRPLIDDLPAKPKINRVVKVNKHTTVQFPEKMRVFGKTKAEILNFPDFSKLFKFPDVQKITGAVSVKFPDIQNVKGTVNAVVKFPEIFKVKVTNFPTQEKISFPETTKIEFNKDQQEFFRQLLRAMEFPLGQGGGFDSQKANPSRYVNVRITNGKQFVEAVHSINSNNGQLAQLLKEINNKTTSSGSATDTTPTTYGSGQATVTTAGTQVQLGSNECKSVTIKAKITNTGNIFVGDLNVDSSTGFILSAGESLSLDISNTDKLWIDSSVNAEGISYAFVN